MCALASPALAAEGVLIVQQTTNGGKTGTNQVQMEKTRMRAEMSGPMGERMAAIFDATRQVLWVVNYDQKSYVEIAKADVDRMSGQMNAALAQMEEQMKSMPPAQRAQMEAMMRGRGLGAALANRNHTQYHKSGSDTVGKWSCDTYDGPQNNEKVSEMCTVDPKVLDLTAADVEISRQLAAFFEPLMPQNVAGLFRLGSEDQGFSGLPVRTITNIGPRQTVLELKEVSRQTFPDSTFALPAGLQKQQMPGGPGRQ
jgi:hypothetical protein